MGSIALGGVSITMVYRIYRMKESVRQQFRWAPHTIGATIVKPKDYEPVHATDAAGVYAVWLQLKDSDTPLQIGDVLESESGELRIYKYVGFEEARWYVPETKGSNPDANATAQEAADHEITR